MNKTHEEIDAVTSNHAEQLSARRFLIINRLSTIGSYLPKIIKVLRTIFWSFAIALVWPLIYSLLPALLNQLSLEWPYGVLLAGALFGFIYTRAVGFTDFSIDQNVSSAGDQLKDDQILLDKSNDEKVRERLLKRIGKNRNKQTSAVARISTGYWRSFFAGFGALETLVGFSTIIYFFNNPQITLLSDEYLSYLLAFVFAIVDPLLQGIFSTFSELAIPYPSFPAQSGIGSAFMLGLIKLGTILLFTKHIIQRFQNGFRLENWFEGNYCGLEKYLREHYGEFVGHEGMVLVFDFGPSWDFTTGGGDAVSWDAVKHRSHKLADNHYKMLQYYAPGKVPHPRKQHFAESWVPTLRVVSETFFEQDGVALWMPQEHEWMTFQYLRPIDLESIEKIRYEPTTQELFFIKKDGAEMNFGVKVSFPASYFIDMTSKINLERLSDGATVEKKTFDLIGTTTTSVGKHALKFGAWRGRRRTGK